MEGKKKTRGKSLQSQLAQALLDAETLQKADKTKRGESYVSEIKLVTARILTLQRLLHRKENSSLQPLKDENAKLKQEIASLKVEVETLKQRPAEPVTPATDPIVEKMLADAEKMKKKQSAPEVKENVVIPSVTGSFPAELLHPDPVRLSPPRVGDEETINLARPVPVIPPAETEKKSIATSCSQFSDEKIQANVERIQREARRNAPQTSVAAIEVQVQACKLGVFICC